MKKYTKIVQYPDPVLKKVSSEVKTIDNDIKNLLKDLRKLARLHSKDGITLVGLSGPQVGVNTRVFVYYDLQKRDYIDVINPVIIYESKEKTGEWEGCASIGVGPASLFGPVKRPRSVQIRYLNPEGEEVIVPATNYQSHILLHEVDHLDGILFLDRVEDPGMIMTARDMDEYARTHNGEHPEII
ncbi:MAG: peptide deformylase [Candidatus Dojkabacteria bacterium]